MYLYLLELIHAAEDTKVVKTWLSQAGLGGVLVSAQRYNEEVLAVLADDRMLAKLYAKLRLCSALSACEEKRCAVYRFMPAFVPKSIIYSFPLAKGEEWYWGNENTAYLCKQSHLFSEEQMSWLTTYRHVGTWEYFFDLM